MITWITTLSNSMKLWTMLCRATQDGHVMVENSDKPWSIGEGNGKPLQYSCLENPMNSMKRQKYMTLKDELPRSVGAQCATGEEQRNSSRRNEETEPKWKHCPAVDASGAENNVRYFNCKISQTEHTSGYWWLRCHYIFSLFQPAPTVLKMHIYSYNTQGSTPLHRNVCFLRMSNA